MLTCPACRRRLVQTKGAAGGSYVCPGCGGRAAAVSVVRRAAGQACVRHLWSPKEGASAPSAKRCPVCQRRMQEIAGTFGGREMRLDVCRRCQFVWFDPHEFESLPPEPRERVEPDLPMESREKVAMARIKHAEEWDRQQMETQIEGPPPDDPWKWIPAMLGMPVEEEVDPLRAWPWVTWGLAALLVLIFAATAGHLEAAIEQFGLIPSQFFHGGAGKSLTSFFIHAGIWHLVGNVYFLLIFGDNVEDYVGRWRYVALLLLSTLGAALLHVLVEPRADIPCVGASGGISGVIVFYALQFPHARLGFFVGYVYRFRWLYLPAWVALVLWILFQFVGVAEQISGISNVSSLAHLGGAAVGVVAWLVWRRRGGFS